MDNGEAMMSRIDTTGAMQVRLDDQLPEQESFLPGIRRAPDRGFRLSPSQTETALKNALRYVPEQHHARLIPEFLEELRSRGRIYGYRFRPHGAFKAKPIEAYQGRCLAGKAFQLMIDNNLDFDVALYPYELVTYGETGSVCLNWMQLRLIKKYLEAMTEEQTLVMMSGHPLGLFQSSPDNPRVIITNGLLVGLYDNPDDWEIAAQMGVSSYGQMTAGGWMYIGPQGIVHGTYNTLLSAGRKMCALNRKQPRSPVRSPSSPRWISRESKPATARGGWRWSARTPLRPCASPIMPGRENPQLRSPSTATSSICWNTWRRTVAGSISSPTRPPAM